MAGWPCFLCGGTRAFSLLADGQVVEAINFAPGPSLLVLGVLGLCAWAAFALRQKRVGPGRYQRLFLPGVILLLLLCWPIVLMRGPGGP